LELQEAPSLKRKKTVTWADGEEVEEEEYDDDDAEDMEWDDKEGLAAFKAMDALFADLKESNLSDSAQDTSVFKSEVEPLTTEQLNARRSDRFMELEDAYETEFWSLANELLLRSWSYGKENPEEEATRTTTRSRSKYADIGKDPEIAKALLEGGIQAAWQAATTATALTNNNKPTTRDAQKFTSATEGPLSLPTEDEISELIMYLPRPDEDQIETFRKHVVRMREKFLRKMCFFTRLEASAAAATSRELDRRGAVAALCGTNARYFLRRTAITIGRGVDSGVDVDLTGEGGEAAAKTVSRQQAQVFLDADGKFKIRCIGRRAMSVNGQSLNKGEIALLSHLSLVRVGPMALMFVVNNEAVDRLMKRSAALIVS
jgi:FHA domain